MPSASSYPTNKALDVALAYDEADEEEKLGSIHGSMTTASFVEGSEDVTHEELATLRHLPDSIPFAVFLVVIVELAERWSFWGKFCIAPRVVQRRFESPGLMPPRLQRRAMCGGITSVPGFHLVRPLVPSPHLTEPTVSPVLSGVAWWLLLRLPTSTSSGFILLPSWEGTSQIVTWDDTRLFFTSLWFVCQFQISLSKQFA
jgi:hypothetical protein